MSIDWTRIIDQHIFAEQRPHAAREQGSIIDGNRRLSSLPPRREDGLSSFFRRVFSSEPVGVGGRGFGWSFAGRRVSQRPSRRARRPAMVSVAGRWFDQAPRPATVPSTRRALDALGRVHHNVSADRDGLLHKRPSLPTR